MSTSDLNTGAALASSEEGHGALVPSGNRLGSLPALPWPYNMAMRPEILSAKPNPIELLHALRRRWMMAVGLGLTAAAVACALVWWLVPVRYEAAALLQIFSRNPVILTNAGGDDDYALFKRTQKELIKGTVVLNAVVRDPSVMALPSLQQHKDDPIGWLENQLIVDIPGDGELVRISMKGERPAELPVIVNAVKDKYLKVIRDDIEGASRTKQYDTLAETVRKNKEDIIKRSAEVENLAKKTGSRTSEANQLQKRLLLERIDGLSRQRDSLSEKMRELDVKILLVKTRSQNAGEAKIPEYVIENEVSKDPAIQQLSQHLTVKRQQLSEQRKLSQRPDSLAIQRLEEEVESVEQQLDDRKNEVRPQIVEQFQGSMEGPGNNLALMETERQALEQSMSQVNDALGELLGNLDELTATSIEVEYKRSELEGLRSVNSQMDHQMKIWQLELRAAPRIKEVADAVAPVTNDAWRKYLGLGVAGALSFGLVLFGVAYAEFQSRRLNSVREINEGLALRVVGELPLLSGRHWWSGKRASAMAQAAAEESIDSIRATLLHSAVVRSPRVVMITSSELGEGKTTVASHLAASLARTGRTTLLIDGDIRNPAAHQVFQVAQQPGLSELLRGEAEREAVAAPTSTPNLWLVPAGQCDQASIQGMSGAALAQALAAWRLQFDFVVIDSGPVLKVADPLVLGQHADVAVLSVLRDVSRIPKVYEACDRLRTVGITVLGAVVNGVQVHSPYHRSELPLARTA